MSNLYLLSSRYFYSIFLFPCRAISHDIAWVLLHGPWSYAVSYQPRCALIRIDAFKRQVTWYFVWEETRRCSGMDNTHLLHSLACILRLLHANSCNKVYLFNSLLTTYAQLPIILQQGCVKLVIIQQSPHNLYTVTNNLTTSVMIIIVEVSLSKQHTDLHTAGFVTHTHK